MLSIPRSPASFAKRVAMWFVGMSVVLLLYAVGKLGAHWFGARTLELSALDRAIPLVPATVWIYGTISWASLIAWMTIPGRQAAARMLATITVASASCALVFLVFPTSFPRALYPLTGLDGLSVVELARLREADSATNCLPSLHVALATGIAATWSAAYPGRRGLHLAAFAWALLVSLSTLTTKQHFALDLPTGAAVGLFSWWAARRMIPGESSTPAWLRAEQGLRLSRPTHLKAAAKLRRAAEGYQWSLDDIDWPRGPLAPLDPTLVRLINELIYVEEIAGSNFRLLERASASEDLRALYGIFADEERRHADGLRRLLELHRAALRAPGLGNSLVLHEFDALDPTSEADLLLIATANPVFETMLDAGTVPFLRSHPALKSPWFEDFVERITRDESAHMALNWMVIREAGERRRGLKGLRLLLNPSIYRGMIAVPFMSLDVYSLAHAMGYRFESLLPAFGRLWRLHRRWPELRGFSLWWVFRVFVAAGAAATFVAAGLARLHLIFVGFWTRFTMLTDALARIGFGTRLLDKRGLPRPHPPALRSATEAETEDPLLPG